MKDLELHAALIAQGFEIHDLGGGTQAMVRAFGEPPKVTHVLTDTGGLGLPKPDDWLACIYAYDWQSDVGREQPTDSLDSEVSPIGLLFVVETMGGK